MGGNCSGTRGDAFTHTKDSSLFCRRGGNFQFARSCAWQNIVGYSFNATRTPSDLPRRHRARAQARAMRQILWDFEGRHRRRVVPFPHSDTSRVARSVRARRPPRPPHPPRIVAAERGNPRPFHRIRHCGIGSKVTDQLTQTKPPCWASHNAATKDRRCRRSPVHRRTLKNAIGRVTLRLCRARRQHITPHVGANRTANRTMWHHY